jgi:spore germination cell wall hydrolase CwlJ-like protein
MVMSVVMNRVSSRRFPNDVCEVVFDKYAFSWTKDRLSDEILDKKQYHRLYKLAEYFIINREVVLELSEGVDHYHTTSVHPYWADSDELGYTMTVDDHKFYSYK